MYNVTKWKTWEKYGKKRIYIGDGQYLDKGDGGLINGHNISSSEAEFIYNKILPNLESTADFDEVFDKIKDNSKYNKEFKKNKQKV